MMVNGSLDGQINTAGQTTWILNPPYFPTLQVHGWIFFNDKDSGYYLVGGPDTGFRIGYTVGNLPKDTKIQMYTVYLTDS